MNNSGKYILVAFGIIVLLAVVGRPYPQDKNYKLAVCYYNDNEKSFKIDDYKIVKDNIVEIKTFNGNKKLISLKNCYLSS